MPASASDLQPSRLNSRSCWSQWCFARVRLIHLDTSLDYCGSSDDNGHRITMRRRCKEAERSRYEAKATKSASRSYFVVIATGKNCTKRIIVRRNRRQRLLMVILVQVFIKWDLSRWIPDMHLIWSDQTTINWLSMHPDGRINIVRWKHRNEDRNSKIDSPHPTQDLTQQLSAQRRKRAHSTYF